MMMSGFVRQINARYVHARTARVDVGRALCAHETSVLAQHVRLPTRHVHHRLGLVGGASLRVVTGSVAVEKLVKRHRKTLRAATDRRRLLVGLNITRSGTGTGAECTSAVARTCSVVDVIFRQRMVQFF